MRYTTIIDITEFQVVYRNVHARLLYLHLVLKSGYHDQDRDLVALSLRSMAEQAGLTLSATRHAISQLERAGLLSKEGDRWRVKKWFIENPPSPRPRQKQGQDARQAGNVGDQWEREQRERQHQILTAVRSCSRQELEEWLSELQNHRSTIHHGCRLQPNQQTITWLQSIIEKL